MNDTVVLGTHCEVLDAEFLAVSLQGFNLLAAYWVVNDLLLVTWGVVVRHGNYMVWAEYLDALVTQCVESLWRCNFMRIQAVYVKLGRSVFNNLNNVAVPDFVKKCIHISMLELVYTINIGFNAGSYNVSIGTETVEDVVVMLNLHVNLAQIIGTL